MKLRIYGMLFCCVVMLAACNLPSDANEGSIALTSVASNDRTGSSVDDTDGEETPETNVELTEEAEQPASDTDNNHNQPTNNSVDDTTVTNNTCTPRRDWYTYTVASGDTLGQIARRTGTTANALTQANCLDNANLISVGQTLYVPQILTTIQDDHPDTVTDNPCRIIINNRTEVVDTPQGTGRTVLGYLEASTTVEPVLHFEGLSYYGIRYQGAIGWVNVAPTGDCSNIPNSIDDNPPSNDNGRSWDCTVKTQHALQIYSLPDASSQVVGTLEAGITYEVVAKSPASWYRVQFSNLGQGWVQVEASGNCENVEQQIFNCQFVGDTRVPIYREPEIGAEQWGTLQVGDVYRFASFAGEWTSGDVSGYWIEVFYTVQRPIAGYIQNTGGHLQGECPSR